MPPNPHHTKKRSLALLIAVSSVFIIFIVTGFWHAHFKNNPGNSQPPVATSSAPTGTIGLPTPSSTVPNQIATTSTNLSPSSAIATSSPAILVPTGHTIGIAAGSQLVGLSDDSLNKYLDGVATLGSTWVRFDFDWGLVQPSNANTYDWSAYDRIINAIFAHHMEPLGIIDNTPPWARTPDCTGGSHCPPADPNAFAKFAANVAGRYAAQGAHYWEIWNEPNDYDFWATKTNCSAYTAVLKASYPAIKNADKHAFVIAGGLAQVVTDDKNISPTDFLQCVYASGGQGSFDAIADHPYTFPAFPANSGESGWAKMFSTIPSLRSIMIANGDGNKKIWITEFGTPTNGPDPAWYVSEASQSNMAATALRLYETYNWVGPFFWYTYQDGSISTSTNENFFGLVRPDGTPKPAYDTIQSFNASQKL